MFLCFLRRLPLPAFITAAIVVILTAGCDTTGSAQAEGDLLPLTPGNYWAYALTVSGLNGGLPIDSFRVEITREVAIETTEQSIRGFGRIRPLGPDYPLAEYVYQNRTRGLHLTGALAPNDTLFVDQLALAYPTEVGARWDVISWGFHFADRKFVAVDTLTIELVADEELIETPAGGFRCLVYRYSYLPAEDTATRWDVYEYWSPNVGQVAEIVRSQSDNRLVQESLLYDYSIRPTSTTLSPSID
jgi:hypothetical protein